MITIGSLKILANATEVTWARVIGDNNTVLASNGAKIGNKGLEADTEYIHRAVFAVPKFAPPVNTTKAPKLPII